MKQITLIFSLLITSLSYSQYQPFELTVNYGSEVTLGADLSYKLQNNIIVSQSAEYAIEYFKSKFPSLHFFKIIIKEI